MMFRLVCSVLVILMILNVTSCRQGENEADVPDRSFSGTDDLEQFVDQLRELLRTEPQNPAPVYELYYFSEEWQRQEVEWKWSYQAARYELQAACLERFGRLPEWFDFSGWPAGDISVIEQSTATAQLLLTGPGHADHFWHLTLVHGEWRIDASRMIEPTPPELLEARDMVTAAAQRTSQKYRTMADQIRRGELTWDEVASD